MTTGSLTVMFDGSFWIGLFEIIDQNGLRACKVTFGAEPTDKEVMEFVDKNWHRLQFSQAIEVSSESERKINPKRQLREAKKQMQSQGIKSGLKTLAGGLWILRLAMKRHHIFSISFTPVLTLWNVVAIH